MTTKLTNTPLSVLYSCRIHLTEEQRETLKEAHRIFRLKHQDEAPQSVMRGASLSVTTAKEPPKDSYAAYGLSSMVTADLISSRDTVSLPILNNVQQMLGVEIINRKELLKKFNDYLTYVLGDK